MSTLLLFESRAWGAGLTLCRPLGQHHRLAALLRAASGPARPGELAREDAALAAFRLLIYDVPAASHPPS